jgi:raffinose/stachyose/melibiose transport system permease protein
MQVKSELASGVVFVLPALAIYLFYFILPLPMSAWYSLFRWDGISPRMRFIGLDNWRTLLDDSTFWQSLYNNIILVIASLAIQLPAGLLLGSFVASRMRFARFFKLVFFIPMMLSAVAIGITWIFIYDPNFGPLNSFLDLAGLASWKRGWLGEASLALAAVTAAICWQYIPFYMVLFAAGIAGIPAELFEAALIDGASRRQSFFAVTLPLLRNTIRSAAILSLTGSLKYFALIFVMTEGGPNHSSELLATYMYKTAFTTFNTGYGSTVAVFIFLISFAIATLLLKSGRKTG